MKTYTVTIYTKMTRKSYYIEAKDAKQAEKIAKKDWKSDFGKLKYDTIKVEE